MSLNEWMNNINVPIERASISGIHPVFVVNESKECIHVGIRTLFTCLKVSDQTALQMLISAYLWSRRWELMCGVEEKEGRKPAEGMTG